MDLSSAGEKVLARFAERTRMAGGPRVGYVLRKRAIAAGLGEAAEELEAGLAAVVDQGLVAANEGGDFYFLTEQGADLLKSRAAGAAGS